MWGLQGDLLQYQVGRYLKSGELIWKSGDRLQQKLCMLVLVSVSPIFVLVEFQGLLVAQVLRKP